MPASECLVQTKPLHSNQHEFHASHYSNTFTIRGESECCESIIAKGEHVFVGISPFNSRFSKEYIRAVINWSLVRFSQIDILMPSVDEASRLLVATGYSEEKAKKKTQRELRRHKKHLDELFSSSLVYRNIRVIDFSDYLDSKSYDTLIKQVEKAFKEDEVFKQSCLNMSRQALLGRLKGVGKGEAELTDAGIQIALPYIFAELPFYLNTPQILNVQSSTLIYHRPWPIGKDLYAGKYLLKIGENQSYGVIQPTTTSR